MVTDGHNSRLGGTDCIDERYIFRGQVIAERCLSEIDERDIIERAEKRMCGLRRLGAIVGFCRWPGDDRHYLIFKYWQPAATERIRNRVTDRRPLVILAGHMSESRGLHRRRR